MIKIEKKVPLPRSYSTAPKYPWKGMKVGDSFLVKESDIANEQSFRATMASNSRRYGYRVTVHKTDKGMRVWRIK